MKKKYKILLLTAGILIALVLLAAVLVSPLAKRYLERNGKELVGRTLRMDKLRFNLFTGNLLIEGFRMLEPDDSTVFVAFDRLETGVKLRALLNRRVIVRRIALAGPDVALYQRGTRFSFDDILAHFASAPDSLSTATEAVADDRPGTPWEIGLYDISIDGGHLFYKDLVLDAVWEFNDLGLTIPGVYFAGPRTDVGLLLQFAGGGALETELAYDMEHADFDLRLRLRELALDGLLPYLRQSMRAGEVSGLLSADLNLEGNTEHLTDLSVSGTADLCGFRLGDESRNPVLGIDTLRIALRQGDLRESRYAFDRIYVSGIAARYAIRADGSNNLAALFAASPQTQSADDTSRSVSTEQEKEVTADTPAQPDGAAEPSATPLRLTVADLEVRNGAVEISDRSLVKPFDYRIADIRLRCRDFDPDRRNSLTVDARMQRTGSARIRWQGSLSDLNDQNILVSLSNIDLRDFSPYCEQFTAYPLSKGNLSFRSQNIVSNRYLSGTNHLDMFDCTVEKRRRDHEPEFRIPLKLGLYVLKDKKGHVKIDLPVKGNLDAPEFSYRKIVMKALGNVLLKVVTAPFSFLTGHGDNLTHIDLRPLDWNFSSEQYARFDRIAGLLREKPEMKVSLTQRIAYRQALASLAEIDLKTDFHRAQGDSLQPLSLIDFEKIQAMNFKSEAMHLFADSLLQTRGLAAAGSRIGDKAMALYADKATAQLRQLMLMRDKSLREYMAATHHLAESAFRIDTLSDEELHAYAGKNRYTIAIEMDGETYEVSSPEDSEQTPETPAPDGSAASEASEAPNASFGGFAPDTDSSSESGTDTETANSPSQSETPPTGVSTPDTDGSSGSDTSTETAARF
ncbi:MAG: DUF748 domain-containing protein [Alistipes sp.]|jgi:hypothetical protein|uniref:DUF748 domain-containing protein n=1 Tax=Alistipes sp. TaxID=1872444 RepID=UPI001DADE311|nr:DUF748 domain-containing protein [Alistipes sp.]MBS6099227.1 DUF748 domain-containing protein [Alistipes sp.]HJI18423.1 DUF748 domain-containing protein [Rikenellaceae bacterium]